MIMPLTVFVHRLHNHSTWMVMPLTVFGLTIQLEWLCRWLSSVQHNHSTWMVMPLTVFSSALPFNLDRYAVDCLLHKHSTWMVMPMTVFGITIQLGWLCGWLSSADLPNKLFLSRNSERLILQKNYLVLWKYYGWLVSKSYHCHTQIS
jgi:hypothetical protein